MSSIKIHLENEEIAAIDRLAESLGATVDDIGYAALNRLMLEAESPGLAAEVARLKEERRNTLPVWSDSAHSVHVYEAMPDSEQHPRRRPAP